MAGRWCRQRCAKTARPDAPGFRRDGGCRRWSVRGVCRRIAGPYRCDDGCAASRRGCGSFGTGAIGSVTYRLWCLAFCAGDASSCAGKTRGLARGARDCDSWLGCFSAPVGRGWGKPGATQGSHHALLPRELSREARAWPHRFHLLGLCWSRRRVGHGLAPKVWHRSPAGTQKAGRRSQRSRVQEAAPTGIAAAIAQYGCSCRCEGTLKSSHAADHDAECDGEGGRGSHACRNRRHSRRCGCHCKGGYGQHEP
mmetsp:Transcript_103949/g.299205  ORF Transcript_103949/g.299205 Transcript_103949/m.299205 type:complete len:253 (+) Transcript_103949:666-1424(+)